MSDIAPALTLVVALLALAGGYVRFLLVRANVGAMFDIEFTEFVGMPGGPAVDLSLTITNLSSNLLIVTRVDARVRFSTVNDHGTFGDGLEPEMSGRLGATSHDGPAPWLNIFPGGELNSTGSRPETRSVVFPQGSQAYRKPVVLPLDACLVSVWGSCNYRVHVGRWTAMLVKYVLRPPADLNFTRGVERHLVRRTLALSAAVPEGESQSSPARRSSGA